MILKYLFSCCLILSIVSKETPIKSVIFDEQLIVFVNTKKPIIDSLDQQNLHDLAKELQVQFKIIDINDGAPKEVVYTPTIVFQNHVNRSFFYGRYKNMPRLKNFVRTARMVHQQDADNIKKEIFVWENGRAKVTAPMKLTALSGIVPKGFEADAFTQMAKKAIASGMQQFKLQNELNQSRTTRSFYFDLHPYLSQDGKLFLTAEIYSQYNCVNPIVKKLDTPWLSGNWDQRQEIFKELGKLVETAILQQIRNSEIGDAFVGIPTKIPIKDWEMLGLSLPKKLLSQKIDTLQKIDIPRQWMVEAPQNQLDPILIFSFLSPLDNYAGEVKTLTGIFNLGEGNNIQDAKGNFEVAIKDVTMGDEALDDAVQNKMLKMMDFPNASLSFEEINGGTSIIELAKTQDVLVKAKFKMLGISIPIDVPAKIEAILNDEGELRLQVNASFMLPLYEQFNVEGPDGPSPSKDNMQFYLKFYLKPV